MTFDEWYKAAYGVHPNDVVPNSDADYQVKASRRAWLAALEQSCRNPQCSRVLNARANELQSIINQFKG